MLKLHGHISLMALKKLQRPAPLHKYRVNGWERNKAWAKARKTESSQIKTSKSEFYLSVATENLNNAKEILESH